MTKTLIFLIFTLCMFHQSESQILCPPDITIQCTESPSDLSVTGMPTVFNASGQLRYTDQRTHTQCHAGSIVRTWFLDANGNRNWDAGEHVCLQNIDINYIPGSVSVSFPPDREYECREAIQTENPTWESTGPCDIIGISKEDLVFEADGQSCYKILRKWTVLNWCTYTPGGSEGIWTHTQLIKVVDKSAPRIQNCQSITIGTDKGCEGTFTVSNSATDISPCGNQTLLWRAEIDLWADGSIDYNFGHNQADTLYRLDPVGSGDTVTITLPWPVRRGLHKVHWYVIDLCGNTTSCTQTVFLRDNKKPTPYLHSILSASFDARQMDLMIPARIFDVGSFDNCSMARHLTFSFSPNVNDTIRTIDCNTAGFNFFTIYITDREGNQAEADVILLAFENGSCGNKASLQGLVLESDGQPVINAQFKMTLDGDEKNVTHAISDEEGVFTFKNTAIYKDNVIEPGLTLLEQRTVDIADLKLLQDYLTGLTSLESYQFVAADIDEDGRLRSRDLILLRDQLLKPQKYDHEDKWSYIVDNKDLSDPEMLPYIEHKVTLKEAKGPLHFRAVYLGDITDANTKKSKSRNQHFWTIEKEDFKFHFHPGEDLGIEGLQLQVQLPEGWSEVASPYFKIPSSDAHIDENKVLRVVLAQDILLNKNMPVLSVTVADKNQGEPLLSDKSKILLDQYTTQNIRISKKDVKIHQAKLAPNPANLNFYVLQDGAEVIRIYNSLGSDIHFQQSGREILWNAGPGIYFVEIKWSDNSLSTEKLVKN